MKKFHVTVRKVEYLTYEVTEADGVTTADGAKAFIDKADIETVDSHEIHTETGEVEIVSAEDVTP